MRRAAFGLVFALVGASLIAMCGRVVDRGRFALPYSTFGAGPEGTRAALELARTRGFAASAWTEDVGALPASATLVSVGGCDHPLARPLSRTELDELDRWIAEGGTWIVAGAELLDEERFGMNLRARSELECLDGLFGTLARSMSANRDGSTSPTANAETTWGIAENTALAGLPSFELRNAGSIVFADDAHEVLARSADVPVVAARVHGRGRIIVLASGSVVQNRSLLSGDGAALFLRLLERYAPTNEVLFDEFHVGAGATRSTVRYLLQRGVGAALLQGLLVLALVVWRTSAAFGRPREGAPVDGATVARFAAALGVMFRKSGDARGAARVLAGRSLRRIARHHHLDAHTAPKLAHALRERGHAAAAAAVDEIEALTAKVGDLANHARSIDALEAKATSSATRRAG